MSQWSIITEIRRRVREEEGVLRKEAALRVALCHPSPYEAAMSSLGFQTMYREIFRHPGAGAERAFLPENPEDYRKHRVPILTYENELPLSNFPVAAFSIAYELELSGIFEMLDLSGVPVLRRDRTEKHPLIIAGGPLTYSNPVILSPFVDLIILGEGEELIHSFLDAAMAMGRTELLSLFSHTPGCYVPGVTPEMPEMARVQDELLPACSQILTKNTVLSSMFLVEPERGCSRNCAFCVMRCTTNGGMRLVSPDKVFSLIPEIARRVGLVGAAVTDHPAILELIQRIVVSGREIGVSSLRADRLSKELVDLLARGGYKTLTTASDGASQRMRNLTGRNIAEQHLIRAAELVRSAGLRRMKLYEMIGFPGETMEDIEELIRFSLELSRIAKLSLSISPFVAKKNTPLDGAPFEAIPVQTAKLAKIRSGLRGKADVKPASPRWAWVEYMLSQGSESAGLAAMDAWKAGGSFASWKEAFAVRAVLLFVVGVVLLIPMFLPPIAQGAEEASRREESRFGIYVAGKEIGYEKFSIFSSADAIESKSVLNFQDPGGKHKKVRMETQLSMDGRFMPRAYQLRTDVEGQKGMVTGTFVPGEANFEYQGSGNPLKRGLLVGERYVILDTNVFHHFIFIARLFNLRSGSAQSIEAVIPQELEAGKLKVSEVGLERMSIHGKKMNLHHLKADSGVLFIDLWIDDQKIVYKIALPAKKIEVIRNR